MQNSPPLSKVWWFSVMTPQSILPNHAYRFFQIPLGYLEVSTINVIRSHFSSQLLAIESSKQGLGQDEHVILRYFKRSHCPVYGKNAVFRQAQSTTRQYQQCQPWKRADIICLSHHRRGYPLINYGPMVYHSHGKWPMYRWFPVKTYIYSGVSMATRVITRWYSILPQRIDCDFCQNRSGAVVVHHPSCAPTQEGKPCGWRSMGDTWWHVFQPARLNQFSTLW